MIDVLRHIALLVADEPEFAGAVTSALLGRDPDVEVLRLRIGSAIHDRLVAALGSERDPDVIESLELLYAGALVRAGMGYGSYAEIADRLEKSARLMLSLVDAPAPSIGDRTRHRGLDDLADVGAVFDRQRAQFAESTEQQHGHLVA